MEEELKLVEEARAGSAEAFCRLARLHQRRVRTYIGRFVRDAVVADDLAQEALIQAYRTLSAYRGEAPPGSWLLGIARVMALRHLQEEARRKARETQGLPMLLAQWRARRGEDSAPEQARHERQLAALGECLRNLPEGSAALVRRHYFEGATATALAAQLGKKDGTVRILLFRIREVLRECVRRRLAAEGVEA